MTGNQAYSIADAANNYLNLKAEIEDFLENQIENDPDTGHAKLSALSSKIDEAWKQFISTQPETLRGLIWKFQFLEKQLCDDCEIPDYLRTAFSECISQLDGFSKLSDLIESKQ